MRLSQRSAVDRTPNALAHAVRRRRAAGAPLVDLTLGNPTRCDLAYDARRILSALTDRRALQYDPQPFGQWSARRAVSEELARQGVEVPPERLVLTTSTSEAYAFLFKLLCDPGESVLVPRPGYPLFDGLARYEGVQAIGYRLAWDGCWHIDAADLEEGVQMGAKAIVTVSPNNPTGSYTKRDELTKLASHGLPIISDEVFGSYPLRDDPRRASSALEAPEALVFVLGGLSKLTGLPQLKLSWIAVGGPDDQVEEALARLELIADTWLSVATPVQLALPVLLDAGQQTRSCIQRRTRDNLVNLRTAIGSCPSATLLDPEGGWYAVLRLPRTRDEESWVVDLVERDGVLVQPGWFYDFDTEAFVVLSLLPPEPEFVQGVQLLTARVASNC